MSALTRGLSSGIVLGLVLVLLGQQLGLFDMSGLSTAIEYLLVGALIVGILGALLGRSLGRRRAAPRAD